MTFVPPSKDRDLDDLRQRARGPGFVLFGPLTGIVASVASWLIAVPKMRSLAEGLGVELPATTTFLVDHAGAITTTAVIIAALGMVVVQFMRNRALQVVISIVSSTLLFGLVVWDVVVFWMIYTETITGLS